MFKRIILGSIIATTMTGGYAAESGTYVNAAVGFANIQNWWSAGTALTVNAGYNFNPYFAAEAGVTWVSPITSQYNSGSGLSGNYSQNQSFGDIAVKGTLPLSNIFDAYAKIGIGVGYSSSSINMNNGLTNYNWNGANSGWNTGMYMALGGEFKLGQHWGLTFEDYGMMPFVGNSWGNINVFGVGGKYNF